LNSAGRKLTVENDSEGRISNIIAPHPTEQTTHFIISHYDYDEAGNMICHTDALGQQMLFDYENHLLVKETWRNGHQWYFEYDGKNTGAKCIHTWGDGDIYNHKLTYTEGCTVVENSLGHNTTYYHKNGLPYIKIDGNGAEWQYRHNRFNELEWETDPLGNQQNYS
jgi:YD repeat-containing protein